MSQEFLNTELKPYHALTREEKHVLLDAALDGNVEFTLVGENNWGDKIGDDFHPTVIYRTKPEEPKRVFPTTSLGVKELYALLTENEVVSFSSLQVVANEAIKRYILDMEKE